MDYRIVKIEWGRGKFSPYHHLNQLEGTIIEDFEIIKKNKKYYVHISVTKSVKDKPISSIGKLDQDLNRFLSVALLDKHVPRKKHLLDAVKRGFHNKYDAIIASLQETEKWDKLRELRNKRSNASVYHDWVLAYKIAESIEGGLIDWQHAVQTDSVQRQWHASATEAESVHVPQEGRARLFWRS